MSQSSESQVSVALNKETWVAIQSLIRSGCHERGDNWVKWGEQTAKCIQTALDAENPS